jgi:hypothetical protein
LGFGVLGFGGLGIGPNPQSPIPIPNPQSPIPIIFINMQIILIYFKNNKNKKIIFKLLFIPLS